MRMWTTKNKNNSPWPQILLFVLNFCFVFYVQIISNTKYDGSLREIILYNTYLPLVIIDAFCIILILALPQFIQRILFTLNILFSAFIHTYITVLKNTPTISSILNGIPLIDNVPITPYISYTTIIASLTAIVAIHCLITLSPTYKFKFLTVATSLIVIIALHTFSFTQKPFEKHTINHRSTEVRNSINVRGILASYFIEYTSGIYKMGINFETKAQPPRQNLSKLPQLPINKNIVFIQVECLGYELLSEKHQEQLVMPFLSSLQKNSVVLKTDGVKMLGSSNSDYEIFTTRKSSSDFIAYNYVTDYTGNIIELMAQKGFNTRVFHNYVGAYMNLEHAYKLMGFNELFFSDTLQNHGYKAFPDIWNGNVVSDRDLFDFIMSKQPKNNGKHLDFIITFSMHIPSYTKNDTAPFTSSTHSAYLKACNDTDKAISNYYNSLEDGTFVVIYGDHHSYFGNVTPYTPFIFNIKGESHEFMDKETVFTRIDMSHYLRTLLNAH